MEEGSDVYHVISRGNYRKERFHLGSHSVRTTYDQANQLASRTDASGTLAHGYAQIYDTSISFTVSFFEQ